MPSHIVVYLQLIRDRRLAPKCIKIARPTVNGYLVEREEYEYWANQLFDLLKSGELKVKINKIFPLAEVQQAHKVSTFIPSLCFRAMGV